MIRQHLKSCFAACLMALGILGLSRESRAVLTPQMSGVNAFFGSQSGSYTAADPTAVPGVVAPPAGVMPYWPVGASLPGLPPAPNSSAPVFNTANVPSNGVNNFQAAGGYTTAFTDSAVPATLAFSNIAETAPPAATVVSQVHVDLPLWRFKQPTGAVGYAWEQLNFAAVSYMNTPGLLADPTPNLPLFIKGRTDSGFVQVDGVVNYWWLPINTSGGSNLGTPVYLGSLNYGFNQSGGGLFASLMPSVSGGLGGFTTTPPGGYLELSGHFWVGGDPFEVTISSDPTAVPEPTTLGLAGLASLGLLGRRNRQLK